LEKGGSENVERFAARCFEDLSIKREDVLDERGNESILRDKRRKRERVDIANI
jgi:hypothetical protein